MDAWAAAGGTTNGDRTEAVSRIKTWLDNDDPERQALDLSGLGLTSLPDLPDSVQILNVYDNRLSSLPENLPSSLRILSASNNLLTSLPESLPARLHTLDVSRNLLSGLPENLPASLRVLNVSHNLLSSLPERLPALQTLQASSNLLTSLPNTIITRFSSSCLITITNNLLSERVRANLRAAMNVEGYNGPHIRFSTPGTADKTPARPLVEAVPAWYEQDEQEEVKATWQALQSEDGASAFSKFLDRLSQTVSYSVPEFKEGVCEELSQMAARPELRAKCFLASFGATETCEDAVSYTRNTMTQLRLLQDILDGMYDEWLAELLPVLRSSFRVDRLREIAERKVKSLAFIDEVEVHLAYQVKLREALKLPLKTPDMRFFAVSWVDEQDLQDAITRVKNAERERFPSSLSLSEGWNNVLERLNPKAYAQAKERLLDALMNTDDLEKRVNDRIKDDGLDPNDQAMRRQLRKQITDGITHAFIEPVTREFLAEKGLTHLLDSPWQPD